MEKLYLELPSIERKNDTLVYLYEHQQYNSNISGCGGLDKCLNGMTYEEWLEDVTNSMNEEYAKSKGKVPSTTYFTIRESDNKIVGMVNFRHYLNDYLKLYGGHIGYGIRPSERRKGYAKIQLYLALLEAQEMDIDKVMVDCVETNIGSEKTIQALGGEFEQEVYMKEKNKILRNYWINVDDSLEEYKGEYENKIRK